MTAVAVKTSSNADALLAQLDSALGGPSITNGGEGVTVLGAAVEQLLKSAGATLQPHLSGRSGSVFALPDSSLVRRRDMTHWERM